MIPLDILQLPLQVPLQIPDVTPTQPNGFGGLITILNWIAWFVIIACLAGFIFSAGKIGLALRSGQEIDGVKGAILAVIGCILVGGAAAVFKVLT